MDFVAIAPVTKTVALGSAAVEVTGLSFRKLVHLAVDYPELVPLATGGNIALDKLPKLLFEAPEIALAIFSVGLVGPGRKRRPFWFLKDDAAVDQQNARLLSAFDQAAAGQQLDCLGAIVDLTFKGERVTPLLQLISAALQKPEIEPPSAESTPPEPTPEPSTS